VLWWGNLNEREHLEDVGVDGRIKLKIKYTRKTWTLLMYSKMEAISFSEHGSKSSVSIKCWQFIDVLKN
jgi:hypothetical protein